MDRIDQLFDYPYRRLAALFGDIEPGKDPILTHIGEPQGQPPSILADVIAQSGHLWSKYPPLRGTPKFRNVLKQWMDNRFGLPDDMIDADRHILPVCGTREGLFQIAAFCAEVKRGKLDGQDPVILMPNPLYHVYFGGALMGHAEAIAVPATKDNNFTPQFEKVSADILARTAMVYFCNPGNPTGQVAHLEALKRMLELARRHDFYLVVDECYSELYFGDEKPTGGLEAARDLGGSLDHLMIMNSLSKRSSAPGLRSGFVAGDADALDKFAMLRGYGGAQTPGPLMEAATALWADEAHVAENRALYEQLVDMADATIGHLVGYHRPEAAFFLWFDCSAYGLSGQAAAHLLWQQQGVKVMPGRFMSRQDEEGKTPGDHYIRIALVHDRETTKDMLERVRTFFVTYDDDAVKQNAMSRG